MRRVLILLMFAFLLVPLQAFLVSAQETSYELTQAERSGTTRYLVRSGDTIYSIARSFGVPVSTILQLNPGLDPRYIAAGDVIRVPGDRVSVPRPRLTFSPASGPPNTLVELRGQGFRPFARLRLLVGRTAYDVRRYSIVRANRRGRVLASVELPEWARPGRRVFFALQSLEGTSRTVAGPFRVMERPRPSERIWVTGTIVSGGVECPLLRSDDGRRFSLAGDLSGFGRGDRVQVTGRLTDISICMQGITLEVQRISEAE